MWKLWVQWSRDEEVRQQLGRELRHLQSRVAASPLGGVLGLCEQAWGRGREAARLSAWGLELGVDALREDWRQLRAPGRRGLPRARA